MMRSTLRRRGALAVASLLVLAACGQAGSAADTSAAAPTPAATPTAVAGDPDEPAEPPAPAPQEAETDRAGSTGGDDAHGGHEEHGGHDAPVSGDADEVVRVSMVDIAFEPIRIEIAAGEPVTLLVSNDGLLEHDLDLPAADLHVHGYPGDERTAVLQIDTPGTYEARCLVAGHADAGMIMQVVVT